MASLNIGRAGACVVVIKQPWLVSIRRDSTCWSGYFYIRRQRRELPELQTLQEQLLQIYQLMSKELEDQTELKKTRKYQTAMGTLSGHVLV